MARNDSEICKEILNCKDYYGILGVTKQATEDEIKKGYKKRSLKVHPDKNHAEEAQEAFKKLSQAYTILSDPQKRRQYDQFGNEDDFLRASQGSGRNPFEGMNADDLFAEMFAQMAAQGGLPPELAHIFGAMGAAGGGRRRGGGGHPFEDLLGGMGGGATSFTFTSMGGPGGSFHFSSSGMGGPRRRRPQQHVEEDEDEGEPESIEYIDHPLFGRVQVPGGRSGSSRRPQQQRRESPFGPDGPQVINLSSWDGLKLCWSCCLYPCFMLFMMNALLTGQLTNLVVGTLSTLFINDSNIAKYDIAHEYSSDKSYSFELPRLQRSFFVDESTHAKLSKL